MESLSVGQVVLAIFPFSDLASKKLRPCLIIGLAEFNDVALCQITSNRYESKRAVSLNNSDFLEGSIAVNSYIRPDKIATLDQKMTKQVLGKLKATKLVEIKNGLKEFLEINQ